MKECKIHRSQPSLTLICTQQIEMIINHQYQHLTKSSSGGCYFFNINWFNLVDTSGDLYWVTTPSCDFSNSVQMLKDLLSASLTALEKLITSGGSLTHAFQVDSGITGFNVLANLRIGDTVFSLTDATGTSYSLLILSSFVESIDGIRLYYAKVRVGDDASLTNARKYGDWTVIVSYPSSIITLTIYTTGVGFPIFAIDSS